jgi:hypothetical protein
MLLAVCCFLVFLSGAESKALTIFVKPTVQDGLQSAFDQARAAGTKDKTIDSVDIVLEPGVHRASKTLSITGEHTRNKISVYPSRADLGASVSGGIVVQGWTRDSLESPVGTAVWSAPLPPPLMQEKRDSFRLQAWRGDTRLTLARTETLEYVNASSNSFVAQPKQILPSYYDQANVQVVLYESWTASIHHIERIEEENHTVILTNPFNSQWANGASGRRYYLQNARELLTNVNEFYVDKIGGKMFYVTSATDNPNSGAQIILANTVELLKIEGESVDDPAKDVFWSNITFEHSSVEVDSCIQGTCDGQSAAFLTTSSVHLRFAQNIQFDQCSFVHTGGYAVWMDVGTSGSSVTNSAFHDLGAGGLRVGSSAHGLGVNMTQGNSLLNSILTDGGHVYQMGCGVLSQIAKNITISHNEISHFRYTGISTGWTWGFGVSDVENVLTTFNHIHHIGLGYLSDMGCVYTLGHQPGSQILNNLCHDVQSYNYGGWGYYTDEGSRDEVFRANIALRTKCAGHHQHYGTDNELENNIYFNVNVGDVVTPGRPKIYSDTCDSAIRSSQHARGPGCRPDTHPNRTENCCCFPGCDQGKCSSFSFLRNIVLQPKNYTGPFLGQTFKLGLDNFTFDNNVYWRMNSVDIGSELAWNASVGSDGKTLNGETFQSWQKESKKDIGSLVQNPEFSNLATFQLERNSPAYKLGFKAIDISKIGPPKHSRSGSPSFAKLPTDRMTAMGIKIFKYMSGHQLVEGI